MHIAVMQPASPLRELACHMGSCSVICHPADVKLPPLPKPVKAGIIVVYVVQPHAGVMVGIFDSDLNGMCAFVEFH